MTYEVVLFSLVPRQNLESFWHGVLSTQDQYCICRLH